MYLVNLKTNLVDAIVQTFDAEYPEPDFRNLNASLELPIREQDYPSIWVDFNQAGDLKRAGVDHTEIDVQAGLGREFTRWRFAGTAIFTVVAMTSLERDRLHDEMLRVFAFGNEFSATSQFRSIIESNPFIAMNLNFDEIGVRGNVNTPGTPWGTDDYMYEITLSLEGVGEFYADSQTFDLAPISEVRAYAFVEDYEDAQYQASEDDGLGTWI